jgi:DNA circularisation protein
MTQPVSPFSGVVGAGQAVGALFGAPAASAVTPFYGYIPPGTGTVYDLFDALLQLEWKGIPIPYAGMKNKLRQDLVIHKFVDRDGAHIEGTGRHPLEFTAKVPCLNNLSRGSAENWPVQLYPFTRDALLRACADKSSGTLQHPELGSLTCKCQTMEWDLEAQVRSGVWVDLSWIETDDTGVDLDHDLSVPSPTASLIAAGGALDGQMAALNPRLYPKPIAVPAVSFTDIVASIRGVVDQTTVVQKAFGGQYDNAIYNAQSLEDSLNQAGNASALNWPLVASCERMKQAAYDQKAAQLTKTRPIGLFTVQKDSTMAQLAASIPGASLGDLMILNAAFLAAPLVPAASVLRFYTS